MLALSVLAGAALLAAMARRRPDALAINSETYRVAVQAALDGGDLYTAHEANRWALPYVYPPVVVWAFLPLAPLSRLGALAVVVAVSVVAGLAFSRLLVARLRALGVAVSRVDAVLVAAFVVASVHAVPTLYYGNVNLLLAAALGTGLLWLDGPADAAPARSGGDGDGTPDAPTGARPDGGRTWSVPVLARIGLDHGRLAGVALAVPAVLKAFPALFALWAVRRRRWRAVTAAAAVGLLAGGASLAAFGVEPHLAYVDGALLDRLDVGTPYPADAPYVTVRRPLSVLGVGPPLRGAVAAALLAPVVVYPNTRVETAVDRLVGLYALLAGVLVALPSYFLYVVFLLYPLVALSYLLDGGPRRLFLAGVAVMAAPVTLENVARVTGPVGGPGPLAPLLTVATPLLWGIGLTLSACLLQRRRRSRR